MNVSKSEIPAIRRHVKFSISPMRGKKRTICGASAKATIVPSRPAFIAAIATGEIA